MLVLSALAVALGASGVVAHTPVARAANLGRCGTTISAERKAAAEAQFRTSNEFKTAESAIAAGSSAKGKPVFPWPFKKTVIKTHFHVVSKNNTLSGGQIPQSQIVEQMKVLNDAYVNTTYTFALVNTSRVTNADWFENASPFEDGIPAQDAMKQALRVGGVSTLNIYSVGFEEGDAAGGLLGYATFPDSYAEFPWDDGVVFLYSSTPGGTTRRFDLGGTVQHEVGHWTGLFHTFYEGESEDFCESSTDEVFDTPYEATPASGCPVGRDTCPERRGLDPIHNYMDYSDDICYTEFTFGQVLRLTAMMKYYRRV